MHQEKSISISTKLNFFYEVINMQRQDLDIGFDDVNIDSLSSVAALNPNNSFSHFDKHKMLWFAKLYSQDFSQIELIKLDTQLQNYLQDIRYSEEFAEVNGIVTLAQKMVPNREKLGISICVSSYKVGIASTSCNDYRREFFFQ